MPNLFRHLTCKVTDRYGFKPADGVLKQVQHDPYFVPKSYFLTLIS